ncbi:MAG: hypothetical protein AAF404_02130 [Pseudomonadota bacterium]
MRDQQTAEKFEKAGAQAAEVLGKFIHLASEIGREFNTHQDSPVQRSTDRRAEDLQDIGEQLRRFRESAGYTLDGFARALEAQLGQADVAEKINAVENGQSELPAHWSQALAALLAQCDVDMLYKNRPAETAAADTRAARLAKMFSEDAELDQLSDDDFDKLAAHLQAAYLSAKTLIKK